ncbi:MAG: hypothetical protein ACI9TY_000137 [Alphaproteobacteria bacterium]
MPYRTKDTPMKILTTTLLALALCMNVQAYEANDVKLAAVSPIDIAMNKLKKANSRFQQLAQLIDMTVYTYRVQDVSKTKLPSSFKKKYAGKYQQHLKLKAAIKKSEGHMKFKVSTNILINASNKVTDKIVNLEDDFTKARSYYNKIMPKDLRFNTRSAQITAAQLELKITYLERVIGEFLKLENEFNIHATFYLHQTKNV